MIGWQHATKGGRAIRAFRASSGGAAAVEFALVALPFLALLFAVLQTSLVIFAGQILQSQLSGVSRKMMTGQLDGKSQAEFRSALCEAGVGLFDCDKMLLQVQSFADFSAASPTSFTSGCFDPAKAGGSSCYSPGGSSSVVVIRVVYPWPFGISLDEIGKPHNLVAVSAFRSEPF